MAKNHLGLQELSQKEMYNDAIKMQATESIEVRPEMASQLT